MASTPSKQTPASGTVDPAPAGARAGFGGQQMVNPMLVAPLVVHSTAIMAATAAVGFGMLNQFSAIMLGAMEGALGAGAKTSSPAADPGEGVKVQPPAIRVVVDNGSTPVTESVVAKSAPAAVEKSVASPKRAAAKPRVTKAAIDDLKRISGVGPKLEKVLNDKGLKRFSDVARLKAERIAKLDAELGLGGRILRDNWVGQAKALAKGTV